MGYGIYGIVVDVYQTYCDYFAIYVNIQSVYYTAETDIMLCVNYILIWKSLGQSCLENYFIGVFKGIITLLKSFIVTLNILILHTRYWRGMIWVVVWHSLLED